MKGKIVNKVIFETKDAIFGRRTKTSYDDLGRVYCISKPFVRVKWWIQVNLLMQGAKFVKRCFTNAILR